jgi:hypothetical protein
LTSARSCATSSRWRGWSASSASAVSARSSGSPAATSPASWRVHTASAAGVKMRREAQPGPVAAFAPAATGVTATGTSACARNWARAARGFSASTRPVLALPAASSASNL